jgi:RNA-directed DNA polymerase
MAAHNLEDTLQALPRTLPQRSSRPQPVRRGERPKEDGTRRPLGISGTEDPLVQALTKRILESIAAPGLLATS